LRLQQSNGHRLCLESHADTERVVGAAARASTRLARDDLDRAQRRFAADHVLRPAAGVDRGIDQPGAGVGFGERHGPDDKEKPASALYTRGSGRPKGPHYERTNPESRTTPNPESQTPNP